MKNLPIQQTERIEFTFSRYGNEDIERLVKYKIAMFTTLSNCAITLTKINVRYQKLIILSLGKYKIKYGF